MDTVVNGDYIVMADVVAIVLCWQMLQPLHYVGRCYALDLWQMVLAHCVVVLCGRWNATMADVIALCVE